MKTYLEKLREEKQWKRATLAKTANVGTMTVWRAENGYKTGLETWGKLSRALGVPMGQITDGDVSLGFGPRVAKFVEN